ncbi:MAG: dihydroorotate dehydrogenase-like protein [Deltaproteobacteria bacterium]|nr:dihydroorotate dehydrogenase-like protein [Deltaproteobacteria bacterium]
MKLATQYLGLDLAHPLMPGASPLVDTMDIVRRLEDAGAAAIVLHSLFEEELMNEQFREIQDVEAAEETYPEALTYQARRDEYQRRGIGSDQYLELIRSAKGAVSVPVIASLNGVTVGGWSDYASQCEEAGADALELNVYLLATEPEESGAVVENRIVDVVKAVRQTVSIPLAVKLSPFFSSIPNLAKRLDEAGTAGLVLFNRVYQPDIDIENLEAVSKLRLSDSSELLVRLRWLAILAGRVDLSLGVTGGVHTAADAIKAIMAGADVVQMVSALLKNGPEYLGTIKDEMVRWMEQHGYESVDEMRGSMSLLRTPDPSAYARGNYMRMLRGGVKYV